MQTTWALRDELKQAFCDRRLWISIGVILLLSGLSAVVFSLSLAEGVTARSFPAWALYVHLPATLNLLVGWLSISRFSDTPFESIAVPRLVVKVISTVFVSETLLVAFFVSSGLFGLALLPVDSVSDLPFGASMNGAYAFGHYVAQYYVMSAGTILATSGIAAGFAVATRNHLFAVGLFVVFWSLSAISIYAPWKVLSLVYVQFHGIAEWLAGVPSVPPLLLLLIPSLWALIGWGIVLGSIRFDPNTE